MEYFVDETELQHHGILGMHWGIRRYQNKDGSLTPLGKKHWEKLDKGTVAKEKKRAIREGDIKTIKEKRKYFTENEVQEALRQFDLNKKMSELIKDEKTIDAGKQAVNNSIANATPNGEKTSKINSKYFDKNTDYLSDEGKKNFDKMNIEEMEKAKKSLVAKGDIEFINKHKDKFSGEEIANAVKNRENLDKLKNYKYNQGKEAFNKFMDKVDSVTNVIDKGTKAYNSVAKVLNAFTDSDLPQIGGEKKKEKSPTKYSLDEIKKRGLDNLSTSEIQDMSNYVTSRNTLEKALSNQKEEPKTYNLDDIKKRGFDNLTGAEMKDIQQYVSNRSSTEKLLTPSNTSSSENNNQSNSNKSQKTSNTSNNSNTTNTSNGNASVSDIKNSTSVNNAKNYTINLFSNNSKSSSINADLSSSTVKEVTDTGKDWYSNWTVEDYEKKYGKW